MGDSRRDFLKKTGCALTGAALATQMGLLGRMSAFAQRAPKSVAPPSDYRALVCIYLNGGNDSDNMVVPLHSDSSLSGYPYYSTARATKGLALAQNILLPISVPRVGNLSYGLHPALGQFSGSANNGIYELYAQGKLAIVSNLGPLVAPKIGRAHV